MEVIANPGVDLPHANGAEETVAAEGEATFNEDIEASEDIEDSEYVEDAEEIEEAEDFEDVENVEALEGTEDAEEIKEELDTEMYPGYDQVKKEEPNDEPLDKTLPELGEINDMFDDVDGPEYVDFDYEGIAEVDGVDCFVCEEFKIRQVPKPVIVTRPLYQLFDCIISEHIILDPDYQRDVVWDEGRAALLISSILTGYFIPPIIFNCIQKEVELPDGTEQMQHKRICVDGKQRLTSVWKFMTGQIGFFDSNKPQKKWYFCHPTVEVPHPNVHRNILPNAVKEFFKNQAFCCYEYDELTQDTEETMFQLVQKGIALTPAEKMRAMSTEWATLAKEFEDNYPTVVNLSKQNRASGFRLILTIFAMIQEILGIKKRKVNAATSELGPTLQASPQALGRLLADKEPIDPAMKLKFKSVFDKYETLVRLSSTELSSNRWKIVRDSAFDPAPIYLRAQEVDHGRTFSPLELVGTAILISVHAEKHTDEELLEDIKWMRHYLRASQKDLRVNAACWKIAWEFINVELNLRRSGKRSSPAFMTHEAARMLASKRKATRASLSAAAKKNSKKATSKQKVKPKPKPRSKPAPRPSSSRPKSKRAAPVEIPERLFPNLPPRVPRKVAEKTSATDIGENFSDSDPDATLSELDELSELEEEIIGIGRPDVRAENAQTVQNIDGEFGSLKRLISVEIPPMDAQQRAESARTAQETDGTFGSSKRSISIQILPMDAKKARLS